MTFGRRVRHRALMALGLALGAWGTSRPAPAIASPSVRVLDSFEDVAPWTAVASDGVRASVGPTEGVRGPGLRLDFDLAGTAGYALARRALSIDVPPRYEITFYLRADAPANQLQVKLRDASGENVWWFHRPNFAFSREWQLVRIRQRDVEFAWGPTTDRTLRRAAAIEIGVAAGRGGGRGSVYVSQLALRELPDGPATPVPSIAYASSSSRGSHALLAVDRPGRT